MPTDFLYVYRHSSNGEQELKYSLRSIAKNCDVGKVFIVGDRPSIISGEVVFISVPSRGDSPFADVARKLIKACRSAEVSSEFVVMNDDFIVNCPSATQTYYHRGSLSGTVLTYPKDKRRGYFNKLVALRDSVGGLDYELHCPFPVTKTGLIATEERYRITKGEVMWRSAYGNLMAVDGEFSADFKARSKEELLKFVDMPWFSISDEVGTTPLFQELMEKKFPEKCRFEI